MRQLLLLSLGCYCAAAARLNVLFIVSDDMRPELAPYGLPWMQTPNFDRLANQSTTFARAYCTVAVCAPARTALLTGIHNDFARVWSIGPYFRTSMPPNLAGPDALATLPQWFRQNGYNTTGFGKIFHQGGPSGGSGGLGGGDAPYSWSESYWFCDQYWTQLAQSPAAAGWPYGPGPTKTGTGCVQSAECIECLRHPLGSPGKFANGSLMGLGSVVSWASADCPDNCYPDGLVGDAVVAQIAAKAAPPYKGEPFFLAAGFKRPHLGFYAPKWAFDLYEPESIKIAAHRAPPFDMPAPAWSNGGSMGTFADTRELFETRPIETCSECGITNFSGVFLPDSKHYELRRGYQASVSLVDKQVGRILDALDSSGLRESTIVTFTGDHGWQVGEHGEWGKFTNFELGVRVPLMVSLPPDLRPQWGTVAMAPVSHLDLFPTLIEAAGLSQPPQNLSGLSLMPVLLDPSTPFLTKRPYAFSQYPRTVKNQKYMGMSMRTPEWRFTEWCSFNYTAAFPVWSLSNTTACQLELYDHRTDTGMNSEAFDDFDNVNLAYNGSYKAIVEMLHKQIVENWDGGRRPPVMPPSPRPGPSPEPPQPPQRPPGFLRYTDSATGREMCLTAELGSTCKSQLESAPLWGGPCTAASAVWQQTPQGIELKSNDTDGQCLNLYGGGKSGTCPVGTGIHLHGCGWKSDGDRFEVANGRLLFVAAAGASCSNLCGTLSSDGCIIVDECTVPRASGWAIVAAGGSWE